MSTAAVEVVLESKNVLGEGPAWDEAMQTLVWVDISQQAIHRYSPGTREHDERPVGATVTSIVPRRAGGYALTLERTVAVIDAWEDDLKTAAAFTHGAHPCRMNDAKADRGGRLWAGSMGWDSAPGAGALYRCQPDGVVERMLENVTISNGLGWSPDDTSMYYVDTPRRSIDVFAFDADSGEISGRRVLAQISEESGLPDGLAIDAEGCIWLALWGGSAIHRYSAAGELVEIVEMPATQVSSCAFGGADLRDLYVTSASTGLPSGPGSKRYEGALFRVRVSTPGLPTNTFGG